MTDDAALPEPTPEPGPGGSDPAADPGSPAPFHTASVVLGLTVTVVFIVLDQLTKDLAERTLTLGDPPVPWISDGIGWQLVYNPGAAFGLPAPPVVFLVVSAIVLVVVLRALPRTPSKLQALAYGLLLSGALGNVIDRLTRPGNPDGGLASGYVVDFVAWGSFPRFNVADSAITVGFVLLVIALFIEERRDARATAATDADVDADEGTGSGDGSDRGSA